MDAKTFLLPKLDLAKRLDAQEYPGGDYDDAILILSSIVSSLAASRWPGLGIDKARFTELWARFGGGYPAALNVSIPLLAQNLLKRGDTASLAALKGARPRAFGGFPHSVDTLVVYDETVDMTESDVVLLCPSLAREEIRRFMYPTVFYEQVRSGYVHEYGPGEFASRFPGGRRTGEVVSYLNSFQAPFRRIHFTVSWLCALIQKIGEAVYVEWQQGVRPPRPSPWWVKGG